MAQRPFCLPNRRSYSCLFKASSASGGWVSDRLKALARALTNEVNGTLQAMDRVRSAPLVLLIYRRDEDVPHWTGLSTAGFHRVLAARVAERGWRDRRGLAKKNSYPQRRGS